MRRAMKLPVIAFLAIVTGLSACTGADLLGDETDRTLATSNEVPDGFPFSVPRQLVQSGSTTAAGATMVRLLVPSPGPEAFAEWKRALRDQGVEWDATSESTSTTDPGFLGRSSGTYESGSVLISVMTDPGGSVVFISVGDA